VNRESHGFKPWEDVNGQRLQRCCRKGSSVSIRRSVLVVVVGILVALMSPLAAQAGPRRIERWQRHPLPPAHIRCRGPGHPQQLLPGYWWDHSDLTVAVQAHPSATEEQLAAIHEAIATWDAVLRDCFDGLITLTDVTGTQPSEQKAADIVVHYVPTAGGVVFGGYAICGDHGCPNILVRSDLPPSLDREPYDPEYLGWVTLHEIGHALGLGMPPTCWRVPT
jgi:hypothetical protein